MLMKHFVIPGVASVALMLSGLVTSKQDDNTQKELNNKLIAVSQVVDDLVANQETSLQPVADLVGMVSQLQKANAAQIQALKDVRDALSAQAQKQAAQQEILIAQQAEVTDFESMVAKVKELEASIKAKSEAPPSPTPAPPAAPASPVASSAAKYAAVPDFDALVQLVAALDARVTALEARGGNYSSVSGSASSGGSTGSYSQSNYAVRYEPVYSTVSGGSTGTYSVSRYPTTAYSTMRYSQPVYSVAPSVYSSPMVTSVSSPVAAAEVMTVCDGDVCYQVSAGSSAPAYSRTTVRTASKRTGLFGRIRGN